MKFYAHPSAIVESRRVGARTRIWAFAHVQPKAVIGLECNVGGSCFIENGSRIGDRVTIKNGVCIWNGVEVESDVFIGPAAAFTNDRHPRSPRSSRVKKKYDGEQWITRIVLREGCTIGANATVIGPAILGKFCFVAAGSVVLGDVGDFELVAGNPCRRIGWVNEGGQRVSRRPKIR